jgi:peptidoglycan-associated lipoprotein
MTRAYQGETVFSLIGRVFVLFIGLVFFAGCSTPAVSKPQESAKTGADTKKQAKAAPSKTAPTSSLEALQKGKQVGTGPLQDVNFDFDRYDLRPDAREILKKHAAWLKATPQVKVAIEGHADERGTNEYNLALGARRAESVKRFLGDLGISANRLGTVSYGEELPLCKEQNEICWAKNRRAHFAASAGPAG